MFAADFRLSANWLRGVFADGGGGRLPREACAATALSAAVVLAVQMAKMQPPTHRALGVAWLCCSAGGGRIVWRMPRVSDAAVLLRTHEPAKKEVAIDVRRSLLENEEDKRMPLLKAPQVCLEFLVAWPTLQKCEEITATRGITECVVGFAKQNVDTPLRRDCLT